MLWFRNDLRLGDNPALTAALSAGKSVIPVFIRTSEDGGAGTPGPAASWWLHHSLAALDADLRTRGSRLILRQGPVTETLISILKESGADSVFVNDGLEPDARKQDEAIDACLRSCGVALHRYPAALLHNPVDFRTLQGQPYRVFTPFWRALQQRLDPGKELPPPQRIKAPRRWPAALPLDALALEPKQDWAGGFRAAWRPGEAGAWARVHRFLAEQLPDYPEDRDRPEQPGTSRLSPHLHFGEISPRAVWRTVQARMAVDGRDGVLRTGESFLRQLAWRDFAHHVLFHFPRTPREPLRKEFNAFPWRTDAAGLRAWQRGRTGYPLVDAGMRELWGTGWMHNRVRMIVASFLCKDLRVHWHEGAKWFWYTLVDADLANNTFGWQWVAGCGADAAPYFRVFNPVLQGEKFDPDGNYVRHWLPELEELPARWIHRPWEAPVTVLTKAGVELGKSYPHRIVIHEEARGAALDAYAVIRTRGV